MNIGQIRPTAPLTNRTPSKYDRNMQICARYEAGETVSDLAKAFAISEQRVSQIILGRRQ